MPLPDLYCRFIMVKRLTIERFQTSVTFLGNALKAFVPKGLLITTLLFWSTTVRILYQKKTLLQNFQIFCIMKDRKDIINQHFFDKEIQKHHSNFFSKVWGVLFCNHKSKRKEKVEHLFCEVKIHFSVRLYKTSRLPSFGFR